MKTAGDWRGVDLGARTVSYDERDAILYAIAVGATATELDLVFEERLRVLPTFALTLAQWAPDELGKRGGFDISTTLHGSQELRMFEPLPRHGELTLTASVGDVWDKGGAAVFEVKVQCRYFQATWSLFAPGSGNFGGDRGPSRPHVPTGAPEICGVLSTASNQAVLYRLTGDRHHIHIDPDSAALIGQPRPIMHGLCTLAASTVQLARLTGVHPADLVSLDARFTAAMHPGDTPRVDVWGKEGDLSFQLVNGDKVAISGGRARFDHCSMTPSRRP
ncbi:MaoC/PaaZ C-terminal domain-containing protein [Rhodococcus sp. G-MC3]|uniref:MaoC/PaaZ C-terminal domain-containing protein n=1 Tax=Rhodococcus sp. G-MC3 TaxID=3046209 RepID=UPI0024B95BF9|nr:MaoC/PaaZ C-terminal domain-containing protein [Rhodococcus sp. G-MC3]MDJ0394872.1 MaoC/PaaZ C-terminal domain-containing protein [Rhodococcus sp. G-MC3]